MKKLLLYCLLALPVTSIAQYTGGIGGGSSSLLVTAAPLPVELVSFTATATQSRVALAWKTATETNNFGFAIERKNAGTWTKIGFVDGNGTTNTAHSYGFIDVPAAGTTAYRLKQIDRDGQFAYSQEIEVSLTAPAELALAQNFPNPFNPSTSISFSVPTNGHATLTIFNTVGQEIAVIFNGEAEAGKYTVVQFNAAGLASGLYFSRLEFAGNVQMKRMLLIK